ncbi:FtsX-like permease family protein [Massilia sp. B-10]|nr:FtsX-like permease family protein [Massilia sp. B-10]
MAVAMAARRFMLRHQDAAAMLRCLGMPQSRVLAMFALEFALVGVGASAIGAALGFGAHFVLIEWLGTLVTADMAPPGWAL